MTTTPSSIGEELSLKNFHPESTPTTPPTTPPIMLPRPPLEEVVWFPWADELLKPKDSSTRRGQAESTMPVFPSKRRWVPLTVKRLITGIIENVCNRTTPFESPVMALDCRIKQACTTGAVCSPYMTFAAAAFCTSQIVI
uniref:Uncharacterized protein n=1 Tax=Arundo donax TaxID=35708 RepID=A0A0A9CTL3_ARUDO